jgi:hypothetical protein
MKLPPGHLNDDAFEHEDGDLKNNDTRELSTKRRFGELEAYKQEIKKSYNNKSSACSKKSQQSKELKNRRSPS